MDSSVGHARTRRSGLERSRLMTRGVVLVLAALIVALSIPVAVLGSHLLSDVPTSSTFHNDISVIAAAGITSGCTPTTYCPNAEVTRGQMAAFLRRAGGMIAAEQGTDPLTLSDGVGSGAFSNDFSLVREIQFAVPGLFRGGSAHQFVHVEGRAILNGFVSADMGCPCVFEAMIYVPEGDYTSPSQFDTLLGGPNSTASLDIDTVIPVTPGVRTFRLYVRVSDRASGTPALVYDFENGTSLIATTYPFGTVELP